MIETRGKTRAATTVKGHDWRRNYYSQWCLLPVSDGGGGYDDDMVEEIRVLRFLKERIIDKPMLNRGRKADAFDIRKLQFDSNPPKNGYLETVKQYVAAFVDLWKEQQLASPPNDAPHPRGNNIKTFVKNLSSQTRKRKRDEYIDKGIGGAGDVLSDEDVTKIAHSFWTAPDIKGMERRCDFLLSVYMASRSQLQRIAQLSDLGLKEYPKEGPSGAVAMRFQYDQSKMNHYGRLKVSGCLRHKEVEVCGVGSLAIYLFYRFNIK